MGHIQSVQIGGVKRYVRKVGQKDVAFESGFDKQSVVGGIVDVTPLGVIGDVQADIKHHGGPDKAVLLYAATHYERWRAKYPNLSLLPGAFGENLTVDGLDERTVCVGDTYQIGEVVLEISQPRIPCWKISERWQESTLTDAVRDNGQTGWYARVQVPGRIGIGDKVVLLSRPYQGLTIERLNDGFFKRNPFEDKLKAQLLACESLALSWKDTLFH